MPKFQRHIFVCTHDRGEGHPRGSCAQRGGLEFAQALKRAAHDQGLKRVVRVNKSGCLDQCAKGVACVIYPEGVWYGGIEQADVDAIVESSLIDGQTIERLVIPDDQLTGRPAPTATEPPPTV